MKILLAAAAVLIAIAWAVSVVLGLSLWIPAIATATTLLAVGGFVLFQKLRDRRAAKSLEQGIQSQADKYAQHFKPEQQLHLQSLKDEFGKGVQALKSTGLAGGGRAALYRLPWYMIIGPPGAGKTTALEQSGLEFPMQQPRKLRGVGGTRNCDWWLANDAVILDTAGRYATQDEDQPEWFEFLELLRKYRSRKPINGILVAIAIGDLGQGEDRARELGQTIRMRIDEVMGRLRMSAPVYVLLTKCDLVTGFVDTFGPMGRSERNQAWGFTVKLGDQDGVRELFEQRMDELLEDLDRHVLHQGAVEQRLESRERIMQLPHQLEHYRSGIGEFVSALFSKNVYQGTPVLRGVFFTSGTQEGRPIDKLVQKVRADLGLPASPDGESANEDKKSYFLFDVFRRVIIPDKDLAVRSNQEKKRQVVRDALFVVASALFGLAAVGLVVYTHLEQRAMAEEARKAAVTISKASENYPLLAFEKLISNLPGMCGAEDEGSVKLDSPELYEAACARFVEEMNRFVVRPITDDLETSIDRAAKTYGPDTPATGQAYVDICRDTRDRILLNDRHEAGDRHLRDADPSVRASLAQSLAVQLESSAEQTPIGNPTFDRTALVDAQVERYMQLHTQEEPSKLARFGVNYGSEVERAREALRARVTAREFVDDLVAEMDKKYVSRRKRLVDLVGTTDGLMFTSEDYSVSPAFTEDVWVSDIRKRLYADTDSCPSWVLAGRATKEVERRRKEAMADVRNEYFTRYVSAWKKMVLSVRYSKSSDELVNLLTLLGTNRPQAQLLKALDRERRLELPLPKSAQLAGTAAKILSKTKLGKKAAKKAKKSGVDTDSAKPKPEIVKEVYEPLGVPGKFFSRGKDDNAPDPPFESYVANLQDAASQLSEVESNPDAAQACAKSAESMVERTEANIRQTVATSWQPAIKSLLLPPMEAVVPICKGSVACEFQSQWEEVYDEVKGISNQFPLNPRARDDVSTAKLAEVFGPSGLMWKFFDNHLRSRVSYTSRRGYKLKRGRPGAKIPNSLLKFYTAAKQVQEGLGIQESGKPSVRVQMRVILPADAQRGLIQYEGTRFTQSTAAARRIPFQWPHEGEGFNIDIDFGGGTKLNPGRLNTSWGLHMFIREAQTYERQTGRKYRGVWQFTVDGKPEELAIDFEFDSEEKARLFHRDGRAFKDITRHLQRRVASGCR